MKFFKDIFKEKGIALFTVLSFVPVFLLLLGCIVKETIGESYFLLREKRSEQVFYLTEAGADMAYSIFGSNNFGRYTHENENSKYEDNDPLFTGIPSYPGFSRIQGGIYDGWISWKWEPGDPYSSMLGSSYGEEFMFQIYPEGSDFIIKSIGKISYGGNLAKSIIMRGARTNLLDYTIFDNQDLSEFVRGPNQTVYGKVHANGNLYMRPSGSTLKIKRDSNNLISITCARSIIASQDAWERPWQSGSHIYIDNNNGNEVELIGGAEGTAYDHNHTQWAENIPDNNTGSLDRWGGTVKDSATGAQTINVPNFKSFTEEGYYDEKSRTAGLRITGNGVEYFNGSTTIPSVVQNAVITPQERVTAGGSTSFWNENEGRSETVIDIDIKKMLDPDGNGNSSDKIWPDNGIIYANTPVRIINGEELPGPATIVSPYNVYVKSDFNMELPTQADYNSHTSNQSYTKKQPAAICSTSRVYFLSGSWKDSEHPSGTRVLKYANDPKKTGYTNDLNNLVEVNGALIDGTPTVDERYYRKEWGGSINPYYNNNQNNQWQNVDDLLEDWGTSRTLKKRGSIIHLQNSTMSDWNNSNAGSGIAAWVTGAQYNPPYRDYGPDPSLATNHPPEFPRGAQITSWQSGGVENE